MDRTETHISDLNSIVGGESVGEDMRRRVYGFNLPFSSGIPRALTSPLQSLLHSETKEKERTVEPLTWQDDHHVADEDQMCRNDYINPRKHLVKTQLNPRSGFKTSALPDVDGTVVVMGGYRGSTLRDAKTHRQVWVPLKVTLNMRKVNLELGLDDDAEKLATEKVYPDSMLTHVGPIDIAKKLLRRLGQQRNCRVYDWGYDWRLSCSCNSQKFVDYLRKLHVHDPRGAIVIAHSMGGLVAHHALQRLLQAAGEQHLIRAMIYVGSPSQCVPILGPLRLNDPVLFAKDILTPKVTFTMRSSFAFLPDDGKCFVKSDNPDERYDIDFWDVDNWIKHSLTPCVALDPELRRTQVATHDDAELDHDDAVKYLRRTLARNREFRDSLHPLPDAKYPPMAVIYGNTLPTVVGAKVADIPAITTTRYETPLYGSGDGIVFRKSLAPIQFGFDPDEYKIKIIATKDGHIGLLSNMVAVGEALAHVIQAEGTTPTYSLVKKKRFARTRAKVRGIKPWSRARSFFKRSSPETSASNSPKSVTPNETRSGTPTATVVDDSSSETSDSDTLMDGHLVDSDEQVSPVSVRVPGSPQVQ